MVGAKDFSKIIDDFQTSIDFLNDFLGLENDRLVRFLTNCVLSFIVTDCLQAYLLQTKGTSDRQSDSLLSLIFFLERLKNPTVKARVVAFLFGRKVGAMHSELFLSNFDTFAPVTEKYFTDGAPNTKSPVIAAQLIAVYEKHFTTKFDNVSNMSLNEVARQAVDTFAKASSSPEKKFHCAYSQRTGMISYLPWGAELLPYAINDPVSLIEVQENPTENQIRTLLLTQLLVG